MTNEERLRELGDDDQSYLLTPERAACLAGAEALRLLREYQDAWHAFLRCRTKHDSTREHQALSAAQAALLATEVTR